MNVENHVIQPAIVGRAVNLSPPATMLAALVGGAAAGVPGALLATPLVGAVKAVYLDSRGEMPEPEPARLRSRLGAVVRRKRRAPEASIAEPAEPGPAEPAEPEEPEEPEEPAEPESSPT
jgi:hypothetical protein